MGSGTDFQMYGVEKLENVEMLPPQYFSPLEHEFL